MDGIMSHDVNEYISIASPSSRKINFLCFLIASFYFVWVYFGKRMLLIAIVTFNQMLGHTISNGELEIYMYKIVGGNILGKAVCEDLCLSAGSFTSANGPVLNVNDVTRSAGGSSSGSGALVGMGRKMSCMVRFDNHTTQARISFLNNISNCITATQHLAKH